MERLTRIPEKVRHNYYRVSIAVVGLAGSYGIVTDTQAAGWVAVATALFGGALATANTSSVEPPEAPPEFP
jgi:hypothetical protein